LGWDAAGKSTKKEPVRREFSVPPFSLHSGTLLNPAFVLSLNVRHPRHEVVGRLVPADADPFPLTWRTRSWGAWYADDADPFPLTWRTRSWGTWFPMVPTRSP
jgi:hypothetical protein